MKRLPFMEEVENNFSQRLCDKLVKKLKNGNTEVLELFNEYKNDKNVSIIICRVLQT